MRAKDEAKFLAEAYKKVILERVVDGKLMCPEACCGAPVMECKCGPDCPHCNCHEIQKLSKEEDNEDIFPNSEYGRHLRREAERHEQEDKRVRLALDSPGYAAVQLPKGHPNIQKYLDKGYKIVKDYKKAEQAEDNEEAGRSHATPELKRKDKERQMRDAGIIKDRAFATPELKRKDKQRQMWAKRKERWDAWKKKQARSEDAEDPYTTLDATVRDFEQELDIRGDGIDTNVNELKDYIDIINGLKVSEVQKKSALKYLSELRGPGGRAGLEDVDYNFVFGIEDNETRGGAIHKPYVSSFVSDGKKIFGVMGSDGEIVHKTRDKREAYKWFRDNYESLAEDAEDRDRRHHPHYGEPEYDEERSERLREGPPITSAPMYLKDDPAFPDLTDQDETKRRMKQLGWEDNETPRDSMYLKDDPEALKKALIWHHGNYAKLRQKSIRGEQLTDDDWDSLKHSEGELDLHDQLQR